MKTKSDILQELTKLLNRVEDSYQGILCYNITKSEVAPCVIDGELHKVISISIDLFTNEKEKDKFSAFV